MRHTTRRCTDNSERTRSSANSTQGITPLRPGGPPSAAATRPWTTPTGPRPNRQTCSSAGTAGCALSACKPINVKYQASRSPPQRHLARGLASRTGPHVVLPAGRPDLHEQAYGPCDGGPAHRPERPLRPTSRAGTARRDLLGPSDEHRRAGGSPATRQARPALGLSIASEIHRRVFAPTREMQAAGSGGRG